MPDILIFDDDPNIAALLADLLREQGFSVAHYPSADGIMQIVQESRPRLVILDIMMPGIDGLSACREIRSSMATRHVKVVVITAKQFEQDRATAQRYGVSLFVNKPFDREKLRQNIGRLLGDASEPAAVAAAVAPAVVTLLPMGVVVESTELWVLLDAGRGLGDWVASHAAFPRMCWMLLSCYDQAAVEELGACSPLLGAGCSVRLGGPEDADSTLPRLAPRLSTGLPLHGMRAPLVFPQRPKSTPLLYPLREGEFLLAPGVMGFSRYTHHPGSALAYRLELHGRKLVYCPYNDIRPDSASWNQHEFNKFRSLFAGADLLIHGYAPRSPQPQAGAGSWELVVDMAAWAKVRNLFLMPPAGDAAQNLGQLAQQRSVARQSDMSCAVARPGTTIVL
ncbi:MAG TPA: hypothetical protein DEB40_05180 [Elusimicrobia bacterium]|nr:hypothetical protein [Elusimicrobiota bacterium]HBT61117.1 hypothetical protein [Elusimicrobiota bacterium]